MKRLAVAVAAAAFAVIRWGPAWPLIAESERLWPEEARLFFDAWPIGMMEALAVTLIVAVGALVYLSADPPRWTARVVVVGLGAVYLTVASVAWHGFLGDSRRVQGQAAFKDWALALALTVLVTTWLLSRTTRGLREAIVDKGLGRREADQTHRWAIAGVVEAAAVGLIAGASLAALIGWLASWDNGLPAVAIVPLIAASVAALGIGLAWALRQAKTDATTGSP